MNLQIKAIPGHQYYYADKAGNIYSVTPENKAKFFDIAKLNVIEKQPGNFWSETTGFIKIKKLKPFPDGRGYAQVKLALAGKTKSYKVHRLILLTFKGPFPKGKETNHKDLNPLNNKLSNLEFVTSQENKDHAARARSNYDYTKSRPGDPF